eukprot:scaffold39805_cov39-Phaeocystis_antarctica.AAC.1
MQGVQLPRAPPARFDADSWQPASPPARSPKATTSAAAPAAAAAKATTSASAAAQAAAAADAGDDDDAGAEGFQAQIDDKFPPFAVETAGHKLRCGAL